ncbi:MAG: helix-turn-helix domain-containing protein [Christensenellales bacterium]
MEKIIRKYVDWTETGKKLEFNRNNNLQLKRYVCFCIKKIKQQNCPDICEECTYEMDKQISRNELGQVFGVTENVIQNWESGQTPVPFENLLLYQDICGLPIEQLVCFIQSKPKN